MDQPNAANAGTIKIGNDITVNRLGFGAMRITGPGVWGEPENPDEAKTVLKRVVELGVNFIDTADSYGPEVSERLIGETLYPYSEGLIIATKGGQIRPGPGQWIPKGDPEHIRQALEDSLKRLKLNCIDLYQLHRIDPKVPAEETLGELAKLQKEGKIRSVGLSEVSVEQIEMAMKILPIVSIQNRYNLTDRGHEAVLKYCEQMNLVFIPWFPLATGELAKEGSPLMEIAKKHNATASQIALAWLLKKSPMMLPIPGTSSVKHLEENVGAASIKLSNEDMAEIERAAA